MRLHSYFAPIGLTGLALLVPVLWASAAPARAQDPAPVSAQTADAVREHLDEAEDMVDSLLEWRHVLSHTTTQGAGAPKPEMPLRTLITVERADVDSLIEAVNAAAAALPASAQATPPGGDLRAHLMKAREIARELRPQNAGSGAVGTSGAGNAGLVTLDRTALQRLEIELEAAESVAPRRLTPAPGGDR